MNKRLVYLTALLALAGCGGADPPSASAQLLPPSAAGTPVAITAPTPGSPVRGMVTITASVNNAVPFGVAAVRFQLDGVNLGAEDTTAPYSVSWDTAGTSEGWHSLTAIARNALGFEFSSDPVKVTVANVPPPAVAVTRYEETDASASYSAGWEQSSPNWFGWSGGTARDSFVPGAQATFSFTGTSVSWIGFRSGLSGIARVSVDGILVSDVDLFAKTDEVLSRVFTQTGLTNGAHTLTISVTGQKNKDAVLNDVQIDAFEVPAPVISHLQETDPSITYTAGWTPDTSKSWSSTTATASSTPGARATLVFTGTSVSWRGYRGPASGTARVYVDGSFAGEVDTYSPTDHVQDAVFTAAGLSDTSHTFAVEATGLQNAASSGAQIVVDAFDVATSGTRFEESNWTVSYTGDWTQNNNNRTWSNATAAESGTAGASATFTFAGTTVSWIGLRGRHTGIARVYLDGAFVTDVDTYAPSEGPQDTVFTATGLANATHTLTIEVTGLKNPASDNLWVVVDAFDVRP